MKTHIEIIGWILIVLAFIHVSFPRYFKWKDELIVISHINRQLMYVHTFFIAFAVFLMGVLCATSANELITTALGNKICLGFGIFWAVRLFFQFFVYSSKLWKGKRFETIIHVLFSFLWTYVSIVFILAYLQ